MNRLSLIAIVGTGGSIFAASGSAAAAGMATPLPSLGVPGISLEAVALPLADPLLVWGPLLLALALLVVPLMWCIYVDARKASPSKPRVVPERRAVMPSPRLIWRPALAAMMAWVLAVFGVMPQAGARLLSITKTVSGETGGRALDKPES